MENFIFAALAVFGIFALVGAAITFAWLVGMGAGRVVGCVMQVQDRSAIQSDIPTPQELAEIDQLIRESRQTAKLPPIN